MIHMSVTKDAAIPPSDLYLSASHLSNRTSQSQGYDNIPLDEAM